MLDNCINILQCEQRLSQKISGVRLLGQLDFSPRDVEKLAGFIREQILTDIHQGTEYLRKHAPSSLACFLVWEGILNYQEGDYWSVVRDATGLSDPNWQSRWGQIFIHFLQSKGLPLLEIPGAHRYITPILAHGGIPDYCLDDFFGRVLLPMIRNLPEPDDINSVLQELRIYREEVSEKDEIKNRLSELRKHKGEAGRELENLRKLVGVSDQLQQIKELGEEIGDIEEIKGIPKNPSEYIFDGLEETQQTRELIIDMSRIRDICIRLRDLQEQKHTFAQQILDRTLNARQELELLRSSFKEQVDSVAAIVQQEFTEDKERKRGSEEQLRKLIDQFNSDIGNLQNQMQNQNEELLKLIDRLLALGDGDFNMGVEIAENRAKAKRDMESLKLDLQGRFPDLDSLEQELREMAEQGVDRDAIMHKSDQLELRISYFRDEINKLNTRLEHYPDFFTNTDEPVRRFLLYGGKIADDFLLSCARMMSQISNAEEISAEELGLPGRVVKAFEKWWMLNQRDDEPGTVGSDADDIVTGLSRGSDVVFDHVLGELRVRVPTQYFSKSKPSSNMHIELYIPESSSSVEQYPVDVYRHDDDLLETEETEIALSIPAREYRIRLKAGEHLLREWSIPGISHGKPYMAFNYNTGRLIRNEELPRRTVCLVVSSDVSLQASEVVLGNGRLYGKWSGYEYYILNPHGLDDLVLFDARRQTYSIPISSGEASEIGLVNGQPLRHVSSQGDDVYIGRPPNIRIPLEHEDELWSWRALIQLYQEKPLQEPKYYNLGELSDLVVCNQDGFAEIVLSDERILGTSKLGRLNIRLRGPNRVDERFTFCFLPQLGLAFDKPIYLPIEGEEVPKASLSIKTAEGFGFNPETPAELISEDPCCVQIDLTRDFIRGWLSHNTANELSCRLPIIINLPKVQWRIQGLTQWSDWTGEIFSEEWETAEELLLHIRMPEDVEGYVKLLCDSQEDRREIHNGRVCFDLRQYSDTIRSRSGPSVFTIAILDSEASIENINLFRVLDRWKVESVRCFEEFEGLDRFLHISWSESGETDQERAVRLWNLMKPDEEPITEIAHLGSCELIIQDPPSGKYRVQVNAEDPWNPVAVFPTKPELNTRDIIVKPRFRCGQCIFSTFDQHEIADHIREHHIKAFYRDLTYEEIREQLPELPEIIYKCPYCSFYCSGSYPNPTTKITQHVEKCPKAERDRYGKVQVGLHVVKDADEIRQNLIGNLPYIYKCNLCEYQFGQSDIELFMNHLLDFHKDKLYSAY